MSKLIQAILTGIFFTFIFDFFLFLGIKLNYIDKYNIDVYYNILFADNQNIFVFALVALLSGFSVIYADIKVALGVVGSFFIFSFLSLLPDFGEEMARIVLADEDVKLHTAKFEYHGDILYKGREKIYIYDYELKKVIILDKNKVKGIEE